MFQLEQVTKTYRGSVTALADATLTVDRGEFVFLIGPSGSGKSTLMKLLTREIDPDEGRVSVVGVDISTLSRRKLVHLRRHVGHVFQDIRLLDSMTVADNVAFALKVAGESRGTIRQRVPALLTAVGVPDKAAAYPRELSGGQQQRVAIARAIATKPALLLCDEPTGNLDPDISTQILELLAKINQSGVTVLMSTHDDRLVDQMARRVVALEDGSIIRDEHLGRYAHVT